MSTFSPEKLRDAMEASRMGVSELADSSGVHLDTIYKLLRGDRRDPASSTVGKIASTLGVQVDALLEAPQP